MSDKNQKHSLRDKFSLYQQLIHALNGLVSTTTRLIISLIVLMLIFAGVYRSCRNEYEIHPPLLTPNPDIQELYSYLSCIDEGLISIESTTTDESLKIAIKNFKEYKQVAIDMPAFKKYENSKEALNKKEKAKLKSYILTIKDDLESNAKNFSIQLPDCK